jgi:hypothetical protein
LKFTIISSSFGKRGQDDKYPGHLKKLKNAIL